MTDEADAVTGGIRDKLGGFERQVRKRDKLESAACVLGAACFAWVVVFDTWSALSKVGASTIAGWFCVGFVLLLRSSPSWRAQPPGDDFTHYLLHWRRRYEDRIRLEKRGFWSSLVVFLPGLLMLVGGERGPTVAYKVALLAVFVAVFVPLTWLYQARSIRKLVHDLGEVEVALKSVGETDAT